MLRLLAIPRYPLQWEASYTCCFYLPEHSFFVVLGLLLLICHGLWLLVTWDLFCPPSRRNRRTCLCRHHPPTEPVQYSQCSTTIRNTTQHRVRSFSDRQALYQSSDGLGRGRRRSSYYHYLPLLITTECVMGGILAAPEHIIPPSPWRPKALLTSLERYCP